MKQVKLDLRKIKKNINIAENSELTAIHVIRDNEEISSSMRFIHSRPNITSRINIKAVVYDEAKFDVEGMLQIDKGAVNTDTYLKIDVLVMSEKAKARAVPSLEIQEDEVKAGHGATVGMVDQEQIHYLMSRGLSKETSEELIVEAFLSE